jgi:hypothetical protein
MIVSLCIALFVGCSSDLNGCVWGLAEGISSVITASTVVLAITSMVYVAITVPRWRSTALSLLVTYSLFMFVGLLIGLGVVDWLMGHHP